MSVVIPVKDGAALLGDLLAALAAQTAPAAEIIVVDDGSTDGTDRLAEALGATVIRGEGRGPYVARESGWRRSTGDVVAFTDVRSRPRPAWLERPLRPFEQPDVALVGSDVEVLTGPTVAEQAAADGQVFRLERYVDEAFHLPYFPTCNLLVRRTALEAVGGFRAVRSGADADLCWRIQTERVGRLVPVREVLLEWQPRDRLRDLFEQVHRYGRSGVTLRQDHGLPLRPPANPPYRMMVRALRTASRLAVAQIRGQRRRAFDETLLLWFYLYELGWWRELRRR